MSDDNREFWDSIIRNDDGTLNEEAVYDELYDYRFLMGEASKVYYDITCGQMSKLNYYANDIIAMSSLCVDEIIRSEIVNVLLEIEDGSSTVEELLKHYTESRRDD